LLKEANRFLNRYNHCRSLALELAESLSYDWSGSKEDLYVIVDRLIDAQIAGH
jgi:hypothetical protein